MYEEGNGHGPGSDLDAMKAYLMVKVMADPSVDDDAIISEFLDVRPSLQLSCSPPLAARPPAAAPITYYYSIVAWCRTSWLWLRKSRNACCAVLPLTRWRNQSNPACQCPPRATEKTA